MSRPWYLNPYLQIVLTSLLGTASEVFLKLGAAETAHLPTVLPWLGITSLVSKWTWVGIVLTVLSLLTWTQAIRFVPLGIAFTLTSMVHVLVPVSSYIFLGELIDARRWFGIAMVVTGLVVIAKPLARVEERL